MKSGKTSADRRRDAVSAGERQLTPSELMASAGRASFEPIYLLYGDEDFLIEECQQAIIEHALDPATKSFNLDIVYAGKTNAKDIVAHASSFPMMAERRVVVVRDAEKLGGGEATIELFAAYIKNPLASTVLVVTSMKPDFRRKPFTDLKKNAVLVHCRRLYDNEIPAWIDGRIRSAGKQMSAEASRMLHAYVGNSLRPLQNEMEKVFIAVGEKKRIEAEDVEAVVGVTKGFTVYDLTNAIGRKDLKQAMTILERMLDRGESPQFIIIMLTKFFIQLWKLTELRQRRAPESEIAQELGIRPYFVKQYIGFVEHYSLSHIEQNFHHLQEADATLKSVSRDPHLVLDVLVYSLIRGTPQADLFSSTGLPLAEVGSSGSVNAAGESL